MEGACHTGSARGSEVVRLFPHGENTQPITISPVPVRNGRVITLPRGQNPAPDVVAEGADRAREKLEGRVVVRGQP